MAGVDAGGDRLPLIASTSVFLAASVVGGLVASRKPENPIGWLFCGFSLFNGFSAVAAAFALRAIDQGMETGAARFAVWFANWSYLGLFVVVIFVLLLFPDGRLPSPRWRIAAWCGALGTGLFAVAIAFGPGPLAFHPEVENPLGVGVVPVRRAPRRRDDRDDRRARRRRRVGRRPLPPEPTGSPASRSSGSYRRGRSR